ncbi:hypothetical protein O0L34_g17031 [Tuta absoluta]|nr:hypothetical protein O0L34_g17031 [Tuta absoluta]
MFMRRKRIGYLKLDLAQCDVNVRGKDTVAGTADCQDLERTSTEMDLEDALDLAGVGKYQWFHCALMLTTLSAAILEMIGIAFVLPAAACDLGVPDSLRGIITSIPNIGIILTAPLWGHAADKLGRKPVLQASCAAAGAIALTASLMPELVTFAVCKFTAALFLACPSSLGFAYAGEMVPRKRRDLAVLAVSGLMMFVTVLSPGLAWAILPHDWHLHLSTLTLKPWRLLTAAYALPLLLAALWMTRAEESPKFLVTKGKNEEALEVLKRMFETNKGLPAEEFSVTSLKTSSEEDDNSISTDDAQVELTGGRRSKSALSLLRPPHLKWLLLTGFLMFGLFSVLNGLFLFVTDTINKVMKDTSHEEGTLCILMNQTQNQTSAGCDDHISNDTFLLMVTTTLIYGVIVLGVSLCPVSKKTLLFGMFTVNGVACLLSGLLTNRMVAGAAMSALQLTSLGVGPLTAYAVQLFPTSLRGTAVGAVLMCGRVGSVVGANAAGYFLAMACSSTFYTFTALLIACAVLSLLLPKEERSSTSLEPTNVTINCGS